MPQNEPVAADGPLRAAGETEGKRRKDRGKTKLLELNQFSSIIGILKLIVFIKVSGSPGCP
jgi:hypothetical protein